jgi:hypothetical protein
MNGDTRKNVNKRHPDSEEMLAIWEKCEDVREGQTAVHEAGNTYLPVLSGQSNPEYQAYKRRAVFYGAMSRTVDAFTGMIMRVPPTVDNPSPYLDDVTGHDCSLAEFTGAVLEEVLVTGFGGILVEHSPLAQAVTLAQAQALGARPYLALFDADSVINWRLDGKRITQLILEEEEYIATSEFEGEEQCFYRVLDLDEMGNYRQRKFIEKDKYFVQVGDDIYPQMSGKPLKEIPFYFLGDADELPLLIDLVDLNISHYMTTADLENGCHYTGIPQPWLAGVQLPDGVTLSVGGVNAWVFPDPSAKAEYLEFSGQGLSALEKRLELKEKQMAALGAKMLSDSVTAETATGASLRSTGEFSVLAQLSDRVGKVLSRACSFMHLWAGLQAVDIKLNTDYLPTKMTSLELAALVAAWQAGGISPQTLFNNLKQGEIISSDTTFEDEQAAINEAMPILSAPIAPAVPVKNVA